MQRVCLAVTAVLIGSLGMAESASACSCAEPEKPTLRGLDAAVTARLVEVKVKPPPSSGAYSYKATHTYTILRVWKGARRYNLREGEDLVLKTVDSAACGLPSEEGRRYGLGLYEHRGALSGNLCTTMTPRDMRRAAERSGNARFAGPAGCGGTNA